MGYKFKILKENWKSLTIYFSFIFVLTTICFMLINSFLSINKIFNLETSQYSNIFSLELNFKKFNSIDPNNKSVLNKIASPSRETLKQIGKSKYIDNYDIFLSTELYTRSLKSAYFITKPKIGIFTLRGIDGAFLMDQDVGNLNIIKGIGPNDPNFFVRKNSILISKYVADKNNLNVNDKIQLNSSVYLGSKFVEKKIPFTVTVIGIYDLKHSNKLDNLVFNKVKLEEHNSSSKHKHTFIETIDELQYNLIDYQINTIYLTNKSLLNYKQLYSKYAKESPDGLELHYQSYFKLKNWSFEDKFKSFANSKISNFYNIKSMKEEYRDHLTPVIKTLYFILMFIVIIIFIYFAFTSIFFKIILKNEKEFMLLYREGYSKKRLLNLMTKNLFFINGLIFIISTSLGIALSRCFISSKFINKLTNLFTSHNIQTGSNLEILGANFINLDLDYVKYIHFSLIYLLIIVIFFIIFSIFETLIIRTNIFRITKVNKN